MKWVLFFILISYFPLGLKAQTSVPVSGTVSGTVQIPASAFPQPKTPEAFGAVGDGVTDDTLALQRWAASCGAPGCTLHLGAGKYRITQGILFPASVAVEIDGAGPAGGGPGSQAGNLAVSEILCAGPDITALTFGDIHSYSYNGLTLRNVGFYDPKGQCAGAVRIINESYEKFDRVLVENFSKPGINPPSAPKVQPESGGNLPAGTYQVQVSYRNPEGETRASPASSVTLSTGSSIYVSSPAPEANAASYSAYVNGKLQGLKAGPTAIGQDTIITGLDNGWVPEEFDTSGGFGVELHGTMRGYGQPSAFVNQPEFNDFNSMNTTNALVADRSVAMTTIVGGNFNRGQMTAGCGILLEGTANINAHFEGGQAGASMACLTGWDGVGNLFLDLLRPGEFGVVGRNMHNWGPLRGACSATGPGAIPWTRDSRSAGNDVIFTSNGTCGKQ